jgi:hypothetical protein
MLKRLRRWFSGEMAAPITERDHFLIALRYALKCKEAREREEVPTASRLSFLRKGDRDR